MKKITVLLIILSNISLGQIEKKACFIGNSYTASNGLTGLISDLATADGNTLIKAQSTPGGYLLDYHSTNAATLSMISADEWDYVVLQEQSQLPSFPWTQAHEECFPFAEILVDSIRNANECAIPLFFNTWGRRDGDDWDSINTFMKMNQRLHIAYDYMADQNSGKLSPIGIGFQHIYNDLEPVIEHNALYSGDGSHPSIYGSYLAACCFYEIIFETSVESNTFAPDALSAEESAYLQGVAHHVVNDVDSITIDYTIPVASFSVAYDGTTATFTNTSEHGLTYYWEFGDGETSIEENPVHEYPDESEYTATLTVTHCDNEDISVGGLPDLSIGEIKPFKLNIYPNPSSGLVNVIYDGGSANLEVYTLDGHLFLKDVITASRQLDLPPGIYIIKVNNLTKRLIII